MLRWIWKRKAGEWAERHGGLSRTFNAIATKCQLNQVFSLLATAPSGFSMPSAIEERVGVARALRARILTAATTGAMRRRRRRHCRRKTKWPSPSFTRSLEAPSSPFTHFAPPRPSRTSTPTLHSAAARVKLAAARHYGRSALTTFHAIRILLWPVDFSVVRIYCARVKCNPRFWLLE